MDSINRIIDKFGKKVKIVNEDNSIVGTRAIIDCLNRLSGSKFYYFSNNPDIAFRNDILLYIGKTTIPISKKTVIIYKEKYYEVINYDILKIKEKPYCISAIISPKENSSIT